MSSHKRLTDKGWAQMSALLDEEMPQSKKRRYVFGWWAVAGIMALAGFLGWWKTSASAPFESTEPTTDPNIPVWNDATPAQANGNNRLNTANSPTTPSINHTPSLVPVSTAIHHTSPGKPVTSPKGFSLAEENIFNQSLEQYQAPSLNMLQNISVSATPVLSEYAPTKFEKIPDFAIIPGKKARIERSETRPEMATLPVKTNKKHHSLQPRLAFNIMAGANIFQVKQEPGFLGGLTFDLDFPRQKMGIQSGFVYRYVQFSGESRPVVPVTYDSYINATGSKDLKPDQIPNTWLYLSSSNRVIIPVMKSHQLEIPALLYLQLGHHWRFYGGMTFLRHVWVESADKGLFTYNLKVVTTPDDDAQGNLNNVITGQLPRWENNWQTGVSFRPYRRIELGVFYRSVWNGTPALSDFNNLFNTCRTCDSKYPQAREKTLSSIRPQSLQLNINYKF
jgi:hypothetical protein